jgi:hypothetical protein
MRKQAKSETSTPKGRSKTQVIVTVSRDPKRKDECWIKPPLVRVPYGGTVKLRSGSGGLIVFFPTPARKYVPFRPLKKHPFFTVGPRGRELTVLKSKARRPRERVYVYAVYSKKLKTFAHASLPKMIIGPNSA